MTDYFFSYEKNILEFGNKLFRYTLDLSNGYIKTLGVKDNQGNILAIENNCCADFQYFGSALSEEQRKFTILDVNYKELPTDYFDSARMVVSVTRKEEDSQEIITREYIVYPNLSVVAVQSKITFEVYPNLSWSPRCHKAEIKQFSGRSRDVRRQDAAFLVLNLPENLTQFTAVEFVGNTDMNDNLVIEHKFDNSEEFEAKGNLLFASSNNGNGIFFLQENPPSSESFELVPYDFYVKDNEVVSIGWGITPGEITLGKEYQSSRHVIGFYSSSEEKSSLLNDYLKTRFESRKTTLTRTVNPWGCGDFKDRICEQFLLDEIKTAGECGDVIYQIDDSWQQGGFLTDMIIYNRPLSKNYWDISNKLFNGSFDPVIQQAKEANVQLSLWFAPSRNKQFEDWEISKDILLNFYQKCNFNIFKIDGMRLHSAKSVQNIRLFFESLANNSNGEINFNLDVTASQRGGYFMFLEYGNLFLENRYVCHEWGFGYNPTRTLRNIWMLSKYVRTQKIQIECPSNLNVNEEFYVNKNEVLPTLYPWDYKLAISFFANMLLWFAPSTISKEERQEVSKMTSLHKLYSERIVNGQVVPIGDEPSQTALTGFKLINPIDGDMISLFRELNCEKNAFQLPENKKFEIISGKGQIIGNNLVLDEKLTFAILAEVK